MSITKAVTALTLAMAATGAMADWTLDPAESSLHYVTSKAAAVSEVNSFSGLSGSISDEGEASLHIALATVDTAIDVRNERMREILFKVAEYPEAVITLQVDEQALESMAPGTTMTGIYNANVSLHGISQVIPADLRVLKIDGHNIQVTLAKPLIIGAASFGLAEGVEELRNIAGLPSINPNVVLHFTLVYTR
jgi:polyisoprenoid-binding protein YceI